MTEPRSQDLGERAVALRDEGASSLEVAEMRVSGARTRLSWPKTRVSPAETRVSARSELASGQERLASGHEKLVSERETRVSGQERLVSGRETRIAGQETRVAGQETRVAGPKRLVSAGEPGFLGATGSSTTCASCPLARGRVIERLAAPPCRSARQTAPSFRVIEGRRNSASLRPGFETNRNIRTRSPLAPRDHKDSSANRARQKARGIDAERKA